MKLLYEDTKKRVITAREEIRFSSSASYHLIILTARVKNNEQLTVAIDGDPLPHLDTETAAESPAVFRGTTLHNLNKTLFVLTFLKGTTHTITLETDTSSPTATFEKLQVYTLEIERLFSLQINTQAEDGDRRPWLVFTLRGLPLAALTPTVTYARRKHDSDDVKIKIDGITQKNIRTRIIHFLWHFAGSLLPLSAPIKTEQETFAVNLPRGLHYIEFDADRMPILEKITFDFGATPTPPPDASIPTVDNPQGKDDFSTDPDDILLARVIFGEAGDQIKEAKTGVGFTILNRLKKQNPSWGLTLRAIMLSKKQYQALWDPRRKPAVLNPLRNTDPLTQRVWRDSYEIAALILKSAVADPTHGATHFYSEENPPHFPPWANKHTFKIKIDKIFFYELQK